MLTGRGMLTLVENAGRYWEVHWLFVRRPVARSAVVRLLRMEPDQKLPPPAESPHLEAPFQAFHPLSQQAAIIRRAQSSRLTFAQESIFGS